MTIKNKDMNHYNNGEWVKVSCYDQLKEGSLSMSIDYFKQNEKELRAAAKDLNLLVTVDRPNPQLVSFIPSFDTCASMRPNKSGLIEVGLLRRYHENL